jgi:hypothetical protein
MRRGRSRGLPHVIFLYESLISQQITIIHRREDVIAMLTILAGLSLSLYSIKTALSLGHDATVSKAAKGVTSAVNGAVAEAKTGFAEAVAKARALRAPAASGPADDTLIQVFSQASAEEKMALAAIIAKYSPAEAA